jgi:hypothetical protein
MKCPTIQLSEGTFCMLHVLKLDLACTLGLPSVTIREDHHIRNATDVIT